MEYNVVRNDSSLALFIYMGLVFSEFFLNMNLSLHNDSDVWVSFCMELFSEK